MTIKEGIECAKKAFSETGKNIVKAIGDADLSLVAKVGVIISSIAVTGVLVVKYMKERKAVYTNNSNKGVVDEALELNYNDSRKQKKLHPVMKKVKKELTKGVKPRKNKKNQKKLQNFKAARKAYEKYVSSLKDTDLPVYFNSEEEHDLFNEYMDFIDEHTHPKTEKEIMFDSMEEDEESFHRLFMNPLF